MFTNYLPNNSYKKELSVVLGFVLLFCSVPFAVSQVNGNGIITSKEPVSSSTSLKTVVAGMEFVPIAPGTFEMGEKERWRLGELKLHKVTLTRGFEMGRYEVTQAEWESIMGSNPSHFGKSCGKNCPVDNVTWEEVQEFISKLNEIKDGYNYRLPTEAEWEYACRAGLSGDFEGDLEEMGWFASNSGGTTHEVGKKKANDWGLYDMYGNVFELVSDWYGDEAIDGVKDPTGPKTGKYHVIRGGSWGYLKSWSWASSNGTSGKRQIQPSFRMHQWGPRHPNVGFRLVRMPFQ